MTNGLITRQRLDLLEDCLRKYESKFTVDLESGAVTGLKPYRNARGYEYVTFQWQGKGVAFKVHHIVAYLGGLQILGKTVDHINGVKHDNRLNNLQPLTLIENHEKYVKESTFNNTAKLTANDVIEIRARYTGRYGEITTLSKEYGITYRTMFDVVKGLTWKHV